MTTTTSLEDALADLAQREAKDTAEAEAARSEREIQAATEAEATRTARSLFRDRCTTTLRHVHEALNWRPATVTDDEARARVVLALDQFRRKFLDWQHNPESFDATALAALVASGSQLVMAADDARAVHLRVVEEIAARPRRPRSTRVLGSAAIPESPDFI